MNWKILFLLVVLFLIVGQSCDTSEKDAGESKEVEKEQKRNTSNPDDEYYDNLDDALKELDELEKS